jgi:cyanophycinase
MTNWLSLMLALAPVAAEGQIAPGSSKLDLTIKGTELEVFVHKPPTYRGDRMIMVFHGTLRNADEYRDNARAMGERFGALIVAPKFDAERFPSIRYQRGGITRPDGSAAPPDEWTYAFIPEIARHVRNMEGRPDMPYYLIGHSAGGQFLVRLAAFMRTDARRIVAANAGSLLFPTHDAPFGYGYGNLPPELTSEATIRQYLAQPLTIYVGTGDNRSDQYFDESPEAMKQGPGRYQRGLATFEYAQRLAREKGWQFNWTLVRARMIGHDHEAMFNHPVAEVALFGDYGLVPRYEVRSQPKPERVQAAAPERQRAPAKSGRLFLVGGGSTPAAVRERFIAECGGPDAKIIVLPLASAEPDGASSVRALEQSGARNVVLFNKANPTDADREELKRHLEDVRGIWMPGGVQSRIVERLGKAWLDENFKPLLARGVHFFGTSAGAMVCSDPMITGPGSEPDTARTGPGLGLTTWVIDSHFRERNREGRLRHALKTTGMTRGIGINEREWVVIENDKIIEIHGDPLIIDQPLLSLLLAPPARQAA